MKNIKLFPRVQLAIADSETGSYPTIARTGDRDRIGNYASVFDDTQTVIFNESVQVGLPSTLQQDVIISKQLNDISSSLSTLGVVRKGVADAFVTFNVPGEQLRPYNDSGRPWHPGPRGDQFWTTGSDINDVGDGFTSPIASKTIIEIDLNPSVEYTAGIRNGGVVSSDGADATLVPGNWIFDGIDNYPMMYYNFELKQWEGIGKGIPTSITGTQGYLFNNKPHISVQQNVNEQLYGFAPSYAITSSLEGRQAGIPISNFGFPLHPKFHATSSQLFDMSEFLTHPFVVEKIVYEFSGSYRMGSMATDPDRGAASATNYANPNNTFLGITTFTNQSASVGSLETQNNLKFVSGNFGLPISTFFILNQRYPFTYSSSIRQEQLQPHDATYGDAALFAAAGYDYPLSSRSVDIVIPSATLLSTGAQAEYILVNTFRDIITFAQVVPFLTATTDANKELLARDLIIQNCSVPTDAAQPLWSGSFVLSSSVKAPVVNRQISYMDAGINDTAAVVNVFNKPGGRNNTALPTGRDLAASVLGYTISASYSVNDAGFTTTITPGLFNYKNNPYILFPTDKLIFGWQVPFGKRMFAEGRVPNLDSVVEGRASELTIHPGKGRLLLYGSLIREGKEYHEALNQPMTSPAVHEALHSDNPVLDEFDTEPRQLFSGSMLGEYVTGSMTTTFGLRRKLIFNTLFSGNVDSYFNETQTGGSENRAKVPAFNRFTQFTSDNERFFDTLMPKYDKISIIDGSEIITRYKYLSNTPSYNMALIGTFLTASDTQIYPNLVPNQIWPRAFPFEPRYSEVERDQDAIGNTEGTRDLRFATFGTHSTTRFVGRLSVAYSIIHSNSLGNSDFPIIYANHDVSRQQHIRDTMLHLFGIGDYFIGDVVQVDGRLVSGSIGYAVRWQTRNDYSPPGTVFGDTIQGAVFRGFKYGVHNALPQFSKLIFRRDAFGQFRDMLEQRLDAKFFDVIGLNTDGSPSGRQNALASPVNAKFVIPSTTQVTNPTKTFSSNLSTEATSSVPYFDNNVRNREEPLDLSNINSSIVTI